MKKILKASFVLAFALALALSLASCEVMLPLGGVAVESVTLDKTELVLPIGASETLVATVTPDNAKDKSLSWQSSDKTVVIVDEDGYVVALAEGNATVIVTSSNGKVATCNVIVSNDPNAHIHKKGEEVKEKEVAPTCDAEGSYDKVYYCTYCGEEIERTAVKVDKLAHTYGEWVTETEATCTEAGKEKRTCSVCNFTEEKEVSKLSHNFVDGVCSSCGAKGTAGEDHVHTLGEWFGNTASCTEGGEEYVKCTSCEYTESRATEALGHKFEGTACSVCGAVKASEGLEYALSADQTYYIVTGIGSCEDKALIIPATYEGLPVKRIGTEAFAENKTIESVTLSEGIEIIEQKAFYYCSEISLINLPNTVTHLQALAFYHCDKLESIIIPDSVVELGNMLFYDCVGLKSIVIGSGVKEVCNWAFMGCTALNTVYYNGDAAAFASIKIGNVNETFTSAARFYYSETPGAGLWHYVDGVATPHTV